MQDVHSMGPAGGGQLFGGGDRRLRPHHHQALKCPRCDSLNTKFCYYNNYNLSQPRYFCKNCRRYWTKGGVLRNVPVGGGCRKTKLSKLKAASDGKQDRKSHSRSSSESSSLTASKITAANASAGGSATSEVFLASSSTSAPTLLNISDSNFLIPPTANPGLRSTNPNFELPLVDQLPERGIFPGIGGFTSLMTTSNHQSLLGFNRADITSYRLDNDQTLQNQSSDDQWPQQQSVRNSGVDEWKVQEIMAGLADHVAQIDVSELQKITNNSGLAAADWHAGGDQGLFDFTANVDQSYWSQTPWTDNDPPPYLP